MFFIQLLSSYCNNFIKLEMLTAFINKVSNKNDDDRVIIDFYQLFNLYKIFIKLYKNMEFFKKYSMVSSQAGFFILFFIVVDYFVLLNFVNLTIFLFVLSSNLLVEKNFKYTLNTKIIFNAPIKVLIQAQDFFKNSQLILVKTLFPRVNTIFSVIFKPTNMLKYININSLTNININFLRKNKVFNKGRYSRNRQYYRTGVY